jgi:hypothetical protein
MLCRKRGWTEEQFPLSKSLSQALCESQYSSFVCTSLRGFPHRDFLASNGNLWERVILLMPEKITSSSWLLSSLFNVVILFHLLTIAKSFYKFNWRRVYHLHSHSKGLECHLFNFTSIAYIYELCAIKN